MTFPASIFNFYNLIKRDSQLRLPLMNLM